MKLQGLALEQWRDYFNTANSDIFDIIEHAISVAASDYPTELRLQRDQIAEKLFTLTSATRCSGCDRVQFALSDNADVTKENKFALSDNPDVSKENKLVVADNAGGSKENKLMVADNADGSKESKASTVISSGTEDNPLVNQITTSNCSYVETEALTDEIEREVLRIKDVLLNRQDDSDSELFDSLRRLELMTLTVDHLKATEIGKVVKLFRKHSSKQIRQLAQTLIAGWRKLAVDAWVATQAIVVHTPESVNPTVVVEEAEQKQQTSSEANMVVKDDKSQQMKSQQHEFKIWDELSVQRKLEDTKRKLQERYQEIENAKKRRTIQVMELRDLPKKASGKKYSYLKPGNRNRQSVNGRRF